MVITVHFSLNAPLWQHTLNPLQQAGLYVLLSQDSVDDVEGSVVKCSLYVQGFSKGLSLS